MNATIAMMICVSLMLGFITLLGLIWGIKTRQFDDNSRFLDGTKFDGEDALQDAIELENRRKNAKKMRKNLGENMTNLREISDENLGGSEANLGENLNTKRKKPSAKVGYRPPD